MFDVICAWSPMFADLIPEMRPREHDNGQAALERLLATHLDECDLPSEQHSSAMNDLDAPRTG